MAKIADLISKQGLPAETDGSGANTWYGEVVTPVPVSVSGSLYVIIPDYSDTRKWGPITQWFPRDSTNLPVVGDDALVIFDNRQQLWVWVNVYG